MNKKTVALVLAFVVFLGVFAACQRQNKYGILITDSDGKERVLATDKNGETVTDEANNIIVVVTGSDGKPVKTDNGDYETQRVAHPDFYEYKDVVEGAKFSVAIPEGWERTRAGSIRLTHKQTGAELDLMVKDGQKLDDLIVETDSFMARVEVNDPGAVFEYTQEDIFGVTAEKYYYKSETASAEMVVYVFEKNGTVFLFRSVVDNAYIDSIDFDAILKTVKFK